jgi:anti-anti-sigma regulatory factor
MPFFLMSVPHRGHQEETDVPASIPARSPEALCASGEMSVRVHRLGDGLVVRLSGVLDGQAIPALRREILSPLPVECTDVLVDASAVVDLTDEALAVLLAGSSWAGDAGARFAFSAVSPVLAEQIEALDLGDALPVLGAAG